MNKIREDLDEEYSTRIGDILTGIYRHCSLNICISCLQGRVWPWKSYPSIRQNGVKDISGLGANIRQLWIWNCLDTNI